MQKQNKNKKILLIFIFIKTGENRFLN